MKIQAFTRNQKTILSVDFDRRTTCPQFCDYCYVDNMENIYPAYLEKIQRNNSWAIDNAENFARQLNEEYAWCRKSKSKALKGLERLPVRIYGSGDYVEDHFDFITQLNFKFYIISKSLTMKEMDKELTRLRHLDNLTRIVLSFDNENIKNYENVKHLYKKDGIQFAFTGTKDDWVIQTEFNEREFGIFFNIGNKKKDKEFSKGVRQSCPTDGKKLALQKACSVCNKCWRSSKTKGGHQAWNSTIQA